jgi:uncharacterized repeat protein (TIGR02543 family)
MRNLHLADVPTAENMEITSELTFNAGVNYNVAGITFYLENGNMVTVERRFHSGLGNSIFALVGNTSTVGSGTTATTFEGSPTNGRAATDTRPDAKCEIKLVKSGDVYTAYFRYFDETEWTKIAQTYSNANIDSTGQFSVGLFASYGSGTASNKVATFENFKLNGVILPFTDYKVSFESNGGSDVRYMIADITGTEKLLEPIPTKEGFKFAGWFTDAELTRSFDFDTAITSDMTLYAKWTEVLKEMLVATAADGKINAVLTNITDEAISGQLIIALYDENGRLSAVETKAFALNPDENDSLIYTVSGNQANGTYKVFAWDDSFLPLTKAVGGAFAQI